MSNFINTVALLGDEAVVDACIERTIAEFNDDTLAQLGDSAFAYCENLKIVRLPSVLSVVSYVFSSCTSLVAADFLAIEKFSGVQAFSNCSELKALILRGGKVATINYGGHFSGTPIASGTGYVYVPRALVDSYKAATNWSTYADQFRALEDYTVDGTTTGELDETKI